MTNITKHHSEQVREGYTGEQGGVDFLISWDTIGVYDFLEGHGELVELEVGRRGVLGEVVVLVLNISPGEVLFLPKHVQSHFHFALMLSWNPQFSIENIVPQLQFIELIVDAFLSQHSNL